jgi:hypothetical protein
MAITVLEAMEGKLRVSSAPGQISLPISLPAIHRLRPAQAVPNSIYA